MSWGLLQPDLNGHTDLVALAETIKTSDAARQDQLLIAVLRLAACDPVAQLVAVAGLEGHLRRIVARWATAGVAHSDLEALEADLISHCWAAVQHTACHLASGGLPPRRTALAVVTAAWVAARAPRLRELRSPVQQVQVREADHLPCPQMEHPTVELQRHLVDSVRDGALDRRSAVLIFSTRVDGMPVEEAAERFGVTPESLRQLRTRAERRLARAVARSARATAAA